jgi:hypothetical protein
VLWILLWVGLALAALVVWFLLGRGLWRKASALGHEMHTATGQLDAVSGALAGLSGPDPLAGGHAAGEAAPALRSAHSVGTRRRTGATRTGGHRRSTVAPARPARPDWDVRRDARRRRH